MATQLGLCAYDAAYSPTVGEASNQWLFRKEDIVGTPSSTANDYATPPGNKQSAQAEIRSWRTRGCNFIYNVVKRLEMHQIVASTACTFFHRFYTRQSVAQHHQYEVAGACVLLASKVEEHKRPIKVVSKACAIVALKGVTKDLASAAERWERTLKRLEISVAENCCFDLDITHPHRFIDALAMEFGIPIFVVKSAIAHVNDCMRSQICLLYAPEVIAVAALYFAMNVHGYEFDGLLLDSRTVGFSLNPEHAVEACIMDMFEFYQLEEEAEKETYRQQQLQQQRQFRSG